MPYYDYICVKCETEFEKSVPIAQREEPTEEPCSSCGGKVNRKFSTPYVGDPWNFARKKPDEGFKDRLREMKRNHRGSNINV